MAFISGRTDSMLDPPTKVSSVARSGTSVSIVVAPTACWGVAAAVKVWNIRYCVSSLGPGVAQSSAQQKKEEPMPRF